MGVASRTLFNLVVVMMLLVSPSLSQRRSTATSPSASSALTINTEPAAIVWIDEIRRGVTDESGRLQIKKISPGRHVVRVRAAGFRE